MTQTPEEIARRILPTETAGAVVDVAMIRRHIATAIREAVEEEREACAKLALQAPDFLDTALLGEGFSGKTARLIRSRSKKMGGAE